MGREEYFNGQGQNEWNDARVDKIISVLGEDWFKGKKILEVGCGHGDIGKRLTKLGSSVIFTDARKIFVDFLKADGYEAYVMDNDKPWTVKGKFDLIIHWGLLYHLDKWKDDLIEAIRRSDIITLETEIADRDEDDYELKIDEIDHYDQAFNQIGTLLSSNHLEKYLTLNGTTFKRYDDKDLNAGTQFYSWIDGEPRKEYVEEPGRIAAFRPGQRRFYMIYKNKQFQQGFKGET